jgi:hypothetical protein
MQAYRVYVQSQLDASWQPLLEGFSIKPQPDGSTLLSGSIVDQAALLGVLIKLRDMGLVIQRVEQIGGSEQEEP